MYEGIIEALIKLLAIITDYRDKEMLDKSAKLVKSYLSENLNEELGSYYLSSYYELVKYYHEDQKDILYHSDGNLRKDSSALLHEICDEINNNYDLKTRFLILTQLLNFINRESGSTDNELFSVDHVAKGLMIDKAEYDNLKAFSHYDLEKIPNKSQLLIINGQEEFNLPGSKHIYRKDQITDIHVLRIASINTLLYKYKGPRNLYMNGHKVVQQRIYFFPEGAILKTSRIKPVYYGTVMAAFIREKGQPGIVYTANNISYKFSRNRYGLHPFSFKEKSGKLVGIIGGSGVGKSTFLNTLCGNLKLNSGTIKINGYDLWKDRDQLRGVIGFVPQDDLLIEELTVYQNLLYNAQLCFENMSDAEIQQKVDTTLVDFDLVEARNLVVGSPLKKILSGGQRKRLNLALELMREPSILMVDEPTSGLSSADTEKVMFLLKRQCNKGKLVFANIHQPSSDVFKLLDRLIIMDIGGRVVYNGNPLDAITYFKHEAHYVNPDESECFTCGNVKTEQPLRIIEAKVVDPFGRNVRKRKVSHEVWHEIYQRERGRNLTAQIAKTETPKEKIPDNRFQIPKWFKQFSIFTLRDIAGKLANKQYMAIALLEAPILAFILGFFSKYEVDGKYLFSENTNIVSFLFMSVVVSLFIGLTISAEELFKDRRILKREKFLNLSKGAYLSSKILIVFTISAIQMLTFLLISNYILEIKGLSFSMWAILFSTACFANTLGLNISAGLNSIVAIYILIPLMLVPQLLFSGVIVDFNKMHSSISNTNRVPVIGNIMVSRWSYEALAVNQFANNKYREQLFDNEFKKNEFSFKSFFLIPELNNRLSIVKQATEKRREDLVIHHMKTIENELNLLSNYSLTNETLMAIANLKSMQGSQSDFNAISDLLYSYQQQFKNQYSIVTSTLDLKLKSLYKEYGNKDNFINFKNRYNNTKLENIVKGKNELIKMKEINNRLYQIDYPIYRAPTYNNGNAHFYAPFKSFYGIKINTVLFNIIVIWLLTSVLLITLYFDILRKVISYFEKIRLNS